MSEANNVKPLVVTGVSASDGAWIKLGQVSVGVEYAHMTFDALNTNTDDATISIGVSVSDSPSTADLVELGQELKGNGGTYGKTQNIVLPGQFLYAKASVSGVVFRFYGLMRLVVVS